MENNLQLVAMDELVPLFIEQLEAGGSVTFSPRGNSMKPMLRYGIDTVELKLVPEVIKKYEVMLYRRDNGKYVLHRIVKVDTDTYSCIGDNQYHVEKGVRKDQMIAVVVSFTRKGKYHTTDDLGYKLYCRIWHYSRFLRRVLRSIKHRLGHLLRGGKHRG